jgi:hypothetical protein
MRRRWGRKLGHGVDYEIRFQHTVSYIMFLFEYSLSTGWVLVGGDCDQPRNYWNYAIPVQDSQSDHNIKF